ncbi:MAG: cation diffusion facilitator family transporter [Anaerolineaceae bacterium]|nr:cation diffusion facilitator family transporter [Anaerolineaceae bacterium]
MVKTIEQLSNRDEIQQVLVVTLVLNVTVAVCKIVIGIWSGVLSVSADGVHSLVDASSNVIALFAHRIAQRPPDADHPYGHSRFETIAALGIGAFLLITAFELVSVALGRLREGGEAPIIAPITFVVMIATLVVNLFVTTYELRAARRLGSELLAADAAHTRSDVFVTISVLVSMALVVLFKWAWADIVTTIVIVAFILRAAWEVLSKTGRVLVDTAPYSAEQLAAWVEALPSVEHVIRARSRGSLDAAQIDIDVQVAPEMTAAQTQAISDAIRDELATKVLGLREVEVHFVPNTDRPADYALLARARADALGLTTHEVYVRDGEDGKVMEMHVEVPPGQTLGKAHEQVSQLEADIKARLPELEDVITHIEPAIAETAASDVNQQIEIEAFRKQVIRLLNAHFPQADWHDIEAFPTVSGFMVAMHVTLPAQITVEAAHQIAESAEVLLRAHMPLIERVTIHTEPPD